MEPRLVDHTADTDLSGVPIDSHRDLVRRLIGDFAMQRVLQTAVLVELGCSVALQATSHQQFIKAVEPAQPTGFSEIDLARVNRAADRRLPAQAIVTRGDLPDPHTPGWHHRDLDRAVVDLDHIHPVATATPQGPLADRPATWGPLHVVVIDLETIHVQVSCKAR